MSESLDSMKAEFDTVAAWTADVVAGLSRDDRIPAGCRGSGSPSAMHWFLDHLEPQADEVFLDCGAGIGGPAAFVARETGARPLLTEPEPGACWAARTLFGLAAVQSGSRLPIATGVIDVGWSLGVLCTVDDQPAFLAEVRRVLGPQARFGMLVYCAAHPGDLALAPPEGNTFLTPSALDELLYAASLTVVTSAWTDHFAAFPSEWEDVMASVQRELERRHGDDPRWQAAQEQSSRIGSLLETGEVRGRMLVLQPV